MKKILYVLLALTLSAIAFSCSKVETEPQSEETASLATSLKFKVDVTAPFTKAGVKTAWASGDNIVVFFNGKAAAWLTLSYNGTAWSASAVEGDVDAAVAGAAGVFDAVYTPFATASVTSNGDDTYTVGGADAFFLSATNAAYTYDAGTVVLNISLASSEARYMEVYVPGAAAGDKLNVHGTTKPYATGLAQAKSAIYTPASHSFTALQGDCNAQITGYAADEGAVFYGIAVPGSDTGFTFVLESGSDAFYYNVTGKNLSGGRSVTLPAKASWTAESIRSALYEDGTLIINEKASDGAANAALHGAVSKTYGAAPDGASWSSTSQVPWYGAKASAKTVEFGSRTYPRSMRFWFFEFASLTKVDVANLDVSNLESLKQCFYGCTSLTDLDVSGWTALSERLLNLDAAFYNCSNLTTLDVKAWKCIKVQTMKQAFGYCHKLTELDFSTWHVGSSSKFTSLDETFAECLELKKLDLSGIKATNVTTLTKAFYKVNKAPEINLEGWNVTVPSNGLQNLFSNCSKVESLDLSGFNISAATASHNMFRNCASLKTIYVSPSQDWSVVDDGTNYMFYGCISLVGGNGTTFDSTKANATYARIDAAGTPGYFTAK